MRRSTRLALAVITGAAMATAIAPTASAAPAAAQPAPATYTKKVVAVYQTANDPTAMALRSGLAGLGRFHVIDVQMNQGDGMPAFLSQVKSASQAAGLGQTPAYAFKTRYSLGRVRATEPKTNREIDKQTGKMETTVSAALKCPLLFQVEVYEVASGNLIKRFDYSPELEQGYAYRYSNETTEDAIRLRSIEFTERMAHDIRMPPEDLFGRRAFDEMASLARGSVVSAVRGMQEFQLAVGVTGWDAKTDRVFFGLGKDLKVRVDDSFKIFQDGREIGFVKVRQVGANASEAQPVFMDAVLRVGDKVVEYPKQNWWNSLKGGMLWMGGPAAIVSYEGDLDVGTIFDMPELYLNYNLAGISNFQAGGSMMELGVAKKFYWRRWALAVGPRAGFVGLTGSTNNAVAPGVSLASTLNCHLTADLVWSTSLGFSAYTPIDPTRMGFAGAAKRNISPLGPVAQTGLTFIF